MTYDQLLQYAYDTGLIVYELPLEYSSGLIYGNKVGIRSGMTQTEKKCILAEEIGHSAKNVGNILDQEEVNNRKQEMKGRRWGYNFLLSLKDLVNAAKYGCRNLHETSTFLDVTQEFLEEAIADFRRQYGVSVLCDNFLIIFEPYLLIIDVVDDMTA